MDIHNIVKKLIRKYQTHNPYDLAKSLNIIIKYAPLGSVNGYYTRAYRQKFIVLNDNLSPEQEQLTLSHEIGHAVLHPAASTPFFKENTLLSVDKMEIEANKFAVELLIPDEMLVEYADYTVDQIANLYGYYKKLIELRIKI